MDSNQIKRAVEEFGTPLYLFDLDCLSQQFDRTKTILQGQYEICYAMKANPFLAGELEKHVDRFEVCSHGEYRICKRNGISTEKIVLSGVHKSRDEIMEVMRESKQPIYTIESINQLDLLHEIAYEENKIVEVLLRLTSENQFGLDEKTIKEIIENKHQYPCFKWKGIQYYSGTQKGRFKKIEGELNHLDAFLSELKSEYGFVAQTLEYGPGLGVKYFEDDKIGDPAIQLEQLRNALSQMTFKGHIVLEMGRFLVAESGSYVTQVVDLKKNKETNYGIVDGGIHHLNYYGQFLGIKQPSITHIKPTESVDRETENRERWNLCGSLCTVSDVLVKQIELNHLAIGDILVFENAGAYGVTEGIHLFLSRDLPVILFYSKEKGFDLVRPRFSIDHLNSVRKEL